MAFLRAKPRRTALDAGERLQIELAETVATAAVFGIDLRVPPVGVLQLRDDQLAAAIRALAPRAASCASWILKRKKKKRWRGAVAATVRERIKIRGAAASSGAENATTSSPSHDDEDGDGGAWHWSCDQLSHRPSCMLSQLSR